MDFGAYLAARQGLISLSTPLNVAFVLVAVGLAASSFCYYLSEAGRLGRRILIILGRVRSISSGAALTLLIVGFFLLAWFHYQIYQSLPIIDPISFQTAGRFAVPLWIDTEKIYFWTLLLGIFVFFINRRQPLGFVSATNLVLSLFIFLTVFYSNPFSTPLPLFHGEISGYVRGMETGNIFSQVAMFQSVYGRLKFYYNTAYMWTHPPLLFVAYAAFVISFVAFIYMMFSQEDFFERLAYDHAKLGYLFLTFGILVGYPWAILAWKGEPWWWSPKINITLVMWVLYTAYLHSRLYLNRRGMWRTTALLGIISFLSLVFTYMTTYLIPGTHSYG